MDQSDTAQQALPTSPFAMPMNPTDATRMVYLGLQIAGRAVIEDIQSYSVRQETDGRIWWDTRPMTDEREHSAEHIDMATEAIQFAVAAGLVHVHPQRPYLLTVAR